MNAPIRQIRERRKDLLLLLATAILLALAINCVSAFVTTMAANRPIVLLLLSAAFLIGSFIILVRIAFGAAEHVVRIQGAIAFQVKGPSIQPIEISGYAFNTDFCAYLRAFIQENEAYAKLLSQVNSDIVSMDTFDPDNLNHHTIINSVIEFTILNELDLHLNSYFIENEIDTSTIVTLGRDELGPEVLRNRVIDLITKDMKERSAFARDPAKTSEGTIVYAPGRKGAIYQRLDIELPPKSTITRNAKGFLVITNPLFDLTIIPQYEGFCTSVPRVLVASHSNHVTEMLATLKLHIRIKKAAFVTRLSMELYEWLDSFVLQMQDYVSIQRLQQRLNPDLIEMLRKT